MHLARWYDNHTYSTACAQGGRLAEVRLRKRIRLHQVRVGMFVEELEGAARDVATPVGQFLIESAIHLDRVMLSHAMSVIIDTKKGIDAASFPSEGLDPAGFDAYPQHLAGTKIPLVARIGAICDVYQALTTVRPYKRAWTQAEAIDTMINSPGHFDPDLLKAFVSKMVINGTIR